MEIDRFNTDPKILEERDNIHFMCPSLLRIRDGFDFSRETVPIGKDIQDKYTCCICLQVVQDPKECSTCKIKFCHACKIEQNKHLLACPNNSCNDSSCSRPGVESDYMITYQKLFVKCKYSQCKKEFRVYN